MLIEVELELLVRQVDAELFKGVLFHYFETEDIQNSNYPVISIGIIGIR